MKQEHIKLMIKQKRLKLTFIQTLSHYAIVLFILFMPALTLYSLFEIYVTKSYDGVRSAQELIRVNFFWIIPAAGFYILQRSRLILKEVLISYSDEEFKEAIKRTANELGWQIEFNNKSFFRAYRPFNYTLSWGEMITIIRQKDKLLINSICDPNKMSSVLSFGWNKKNIQTFLINLQEVKKGLPPRQEIVEKPINEWSFGRTIMRVLLYAVCLFIIVAGVFVIIQSPAFRSQIAGFGGVAFATFYLYLDLRVLTTKKEKNE